MREPWVGHPREAEFEADNGEFDDDDDDLIALIDDAMSTVEARPLDQTFTDCTSGERPRK